MAKSKASYTAAVDLGGTNCRAAVVTNAGVVLNEARAEVDHSQTEPAVVTDLLNEVVQGYDVASAVVGVPGIVDYRSQAPVMIPNLPDSWIDHLSARRISKLTGLEVYLANDADLACVGEAKFGAGSSFADVVYVTISTGVGAGCVLGGRLVHGRYSANDVGHSVVDFYGQNNGRTSPEEYGSGPSIEALASEAGLNLSAAEVVERVRKGDAEATKVFEAAMVGVSAGLINLAWIYAPEVIVIGGGVGLRDDLVHPYVERALADLGPQDVGSIKVAKAVLGDDVGLIGAAAWWSTVH